MNKTLTYSGFAISSLFIILVFVTAKTYTQLIIAVLLYPLLAYFALKVLPRRTLKAPSITIQVPARPVQKVQEVPEKVVADLDKRSFLKLIGAAGLSFFVFSLLGRRVESLLFSGSPGPGVNTSGKGPQTALPLEGYKISEIDDSIISYYGFTNSNGAWLIMREDSETSSFRYTKGDNNFSRGWNNRQNLKYDYYYNLF